MSIKKPSTQTLSGSRNKPTTPTDKPTTPTNKSTTLKKKSATPTKKSATLKNKASSPVQDSATLMKEFFTLSFPLKKESSPPSNNVATSIENLATSRNKPDTPKNKYTLPNNEWPTAEDGCFIYNNEYIKFENSMTIPSTHSSILYYVHQALEGVNESMELFHTLCNKLEEDVIYLAGQNGGEEVPSFLRHEFETSIKSIERGYGENIFYSEVRAYHLSESTVRREYELCTRNGDLI